VAKVSKEVIDNLLFYAVGDICCRRDDPDSIFALVQPALNDADILFGQLETNISDRGVRQVHAKVALRAPSHTISAYKLAGFDLLSLASNHCLDWGNDALFDTIDVLKQNGIKIAGAGRNMLRRDSRYSLNVKGLR